MKTSKRKIIVRVILIFILLNIIACPIITKIIYDSMFPRYDAVVDIDQQYQELYSSRKELDFNCDGNRLSGYLYDVENKDILVVLAPGFNASCDNYISVIQSMHDAGLGVFTFDCTGSCTSEGKSQVGFQQELIDLDAALDFLKDQGEEGYENVAVFGHSRGGYAAGSIALLDHDEVDSVVTVGGINSAMEGIMEPAVDMMGKFAYINYPMLYLYQIYLFGSDYTKADCVSACREARDLPILVIHGANDEKISLTEYSIYSHKADIEAIGRSGDTEFYLGETEGKSGHSDILSDDKVIGEAIYFIEENVR